MGFTKADIRTAEMNPFTKISKEWFLLTAGNAAAYNTMTASWGAFGEIWGKNAVTVYVRYSRHTMKFIEKSQLFTLSFLDEKWRTALNFCGSHSGSECNKAECTGLTVTEIDGTAAFTQAREVIVCRKMYAGDLLSDCFCDQGIHNFYKDQDFHKMYIGEIIGYYLNDSC